MAENFPIILRFLFSLIASDSYESGFDPAGAVSMPLLAFRAFAKAAPCTYDMVLCTRQGNIVADMLSTTMTGVLGVLVLRYRASAFTVGQRLEGLLEATNGNVLPLKEVPHV